MALELPDMELVERELLRAEQTKDRVMDASRNAIRLAGKAITLMHAKKHTEARRLLRELGLEMKRLRKVEKGFEYYSLQAHQEYVEAMAFYTIMHDRRLARRRELGESGLAYLLGIMDLVGELRRAATESILQSRVDEAGSYYAHMRSIYDATKAMRFASSVAPDFRKKQDTARIQLENTASELLAARASARQRS